MDGNVKPYKLNPRESIAGWAVKYQGVWTLREGARRPHIADDHWIIPAWIIAEQSGVKWWPRKE